MNEDKAREAFETPAKTVQRWMSMIDYAYQCRDDIRSSSGETPRSGELRLLAEEMRAALQWAASQPQDSKAWAVLGEDGDVSMVFIDRDEALTYCGEAEQPVALVFGGAASQQAAEGWRPMESVPKEPGRYIYVQQQAVYRWLPYKANSQEFKRGKKGRWQKHTGFGFDNAELEGQGWRDAGESAPPSTQGGADE